MGGSWGDRADVKITVSKTYKNLDTGEDESSMDTSEYQEVLDGLLILGGAETSVTGSTSAKVSHAEYWGKGTWDKVPYSVEVFTSVTVKCDQEAGAMNAALNLAHEMSIVKTKEVMPGAIGAHVMNIREEIYPEVFNG